MWTNKHMKHANIIKKHTPTRKPLPSSKPLANPTSPRHSNVRSHCDLHSATARIPRAVVVSGSTPQFGTFPTFRVTKMATGNKKRMEVLENMGANFKKKHDIPTCPYSACLKKTVCRKTCHFKLRPRHRQPHRFADAANDALLRGAKEAKFEDRTWEQTKLAAQNGTKELEFG